MYVRVIARQNSDIFRNCTNNNNTNNTTCNKNVKWHVTDNN